MMSIVFVFIFLLSFFITPLLIKLSLAFNVVDDCNNKEADLKIHKKPIPILGGMAVLLSFILGMLFFIKINVLQMSVILVFCILISTLSFLDDRKQIHFTWRLLLQLIAGIFLIFVDIKIFGIFTIFYVVGVINSFNMIDGMDGLCSGVAIISCVGFLFLGLQNNNMMLIILAGGLGSALLGFLPYNFNPAKIFLGDNGSTIIGFLLGVMAIIASNFTGFLIPLLILGIPLIDMGCAILRRLKARKSIFLGDRGHIYDVLLQRNLSQRKVFTIICLLQASLVFLAVRIL